MKWETMRIPSLTLLQAAAIDQILSISKFLLPPCWTTEPLEKKPKT